LFRHTSRGGQNSVGARQRRGGRSFVLCARKFRIPPRNRTRLDHVASARNPAWAASGHNHGEQKCAEDRGTGGHVRYSAHSRAHRSSGSARRREISIELARLGLSILRTNDSEIETEDRVAPFGQPLPPGQIGRLTKVYCELLDAI